jgi:hypothetical protein
LEKTYEQINLFSAAAAADHKEILNSQTPEDTIVDALAEIRKL